MNGWHNVNRNEPCPICHHTDWCSLSDDGEVCVCRRVESDRPTKSGMGWIYSLREKEEGKVKSEKVVSSPHHQTKQIVQQSRSGLQSASLRTLTIPLSPSTSNSTSTSPSPADHFAALPTGDIQLRLCRYLMRELGLPGDVLLMMDVRWDNAAKAAAFPMRDPDGNVVGIRYRQLKTGRKWALKGSKDGLFYVPEYNSVVDGELIVCEGPTDMLAAVSCGLNVIGRSSCMTGAAHLRQMAYKLMAKRLTIVADADEPKTRPDGTTWQPGIDGAKKLAAEFNVPVRIMLPLPGFKDLREWYTKGAMTAEAFRRQAERASWRLNND